MSEYIRREDAVEALDGKIIVTGHENADAVLQYMKDISNKIKSIEPADVVQVRHARWERYSGITIRCSRCEHVIHDWRYSECNFCPNCGAKMVE